GDGDQPAEWVIGMTLARPVRGRRDQRLLGGVLSRVEVPIAAHQCAKDPWRQLAQQVLEFGIGQLAAQRSRSLRVSEIGRTSMTDSLAYSGPGHFESSAAICVARSKLSHSTIQ